jgi:type I restriction enzyme S subunit
VTTWPQVPLKHLVDINRRALPESTTPDTEFRYLDISTCGRGRLVAEPESMRFEDAPSRARRLVRPGDTLISTVRTYLRAVWPVTGASDDLVVSTGFAVLSPRDRLDPGFLGWLAQSDAVIEEIVARSVGVSYPAINGLEVGELRVPAPDLATQRAIADYLDGETARIDGLISIRKRQALLVLERASREIDVVLRPDTAPLVPLSRVADLLPGFSYQSEDFVGDEGDVRLLRGVNVDVGSIRWDDTVRVSPRLAQATRRFELASGDIVLGMDRPIISAGVRVAQVRPEDLPSLLVQRVARIRTRAGVLQDYLFLALRAPGLDAHFEPMFTGVSVPHVSPSQILSYRIPVPPLDSQQRIIERVGRVRERADRYAEAASRQVDLLLERRQALINAAVTGQLDIPGVTA